MSKEKRYVGSTSYYNRDRKLDYITWCDENIHRRENYLERIFENVGKVEKLLGKDVSEFSRSEIINLYRELNTSSVAVLDTLHGALRSYAEWCLRCSLIKENRFRVMKINDLSSCVGKRLVVTPDELKSYIKELPNDSDAFLLMALFEGIRGKDYCELLNLRFSDFDAVNKTVKLCTGRQINVSDRLIKLARDASCETEHIALTRRAFPVPYMEKDDTVVKTSYGATEETSEEQKRTRIYARFRRIRQYLGKTWTVDDIVRSGMLHFINKRCRELNITGHRYLYSSRIDELKQQYGKTFLRKNTFELEMRDKLITRTAA